MLSNLHNFRPTRLALLVNVDREIAHFNHLVTAYYKGVLCWPNRFGIKTSLITQKAPIITDVWGFFVSP